jgi:hypothetical protein
MLSAYCPRHHHDVLVTPGQIISIDGRGPTLAVRWECACGHVGVHRPQRPHRPALAA